MKEKGLDNIMKKHMKNSGHEIDLVQPVMGRIRKYEEKRSARMLYLEYALSAVIFISGIVSIFFIRNYSPLFNKIIFSYKEF